MKQFLILFFSFFTLLTFTFGQGNMITVNTQLPASITICGAAQSVSVEIINPSPFNMSNVTMKVTMPQGLNYVTGSITGATEFNLTVLNEPVFSLANLPSQGAVMVTLSIAANCQLIDFISRAIS